MYEPNFLPVEIWLKIFRKLCHKDLFNAVMVCKEWRMIGLDQGLWKNYEMVKKDGNLKTLERTLNIERFSAMEQLEIVGDCFPKMIFEVIEQKNQFGPKILDHHVDAIRRSKICKLDIDNCDLSLVSPSKVSELFNQLEHISIRESKLTEHQLREIIYDMAYNTDLKEFILDTVFVEKEDDNLEMPLTDPETIGWAFNKMETLKLRSVFKQTTFSDNYFDTPPQNFLMLFRIMFQKTNLKSLDLDSDFLNHIPIVILCSSLNNLQTVNLTGSSFTADQCKTLVTQMAKETKIQELYIPMSDLSSIEAEILSKAFNKLRKLDILGSKIRRYQVTALFKGIKQGTKLEFLNLNRVMVDLLSSNILTSGLLLLKTVQVFKLNRDQINLLMTKLSEIDNPVVRNLTIYEAETEHIPQHVLAKAINKMKSIEITRSIFCMDPIPRKPTNFIPTFLTIRSESFLTDISFESVNLSTIPPGVLSEAIKRLRKVRLVRAKLCNSQLISVLNNIPLSSSLEHLDLSGNYLSCLPTCQMLAEPLPKLKRVILEDTKLAKRQIKAILSEIAGKPFGTTLEYISLAQNDAEEVSIDLIQEVKSIVKHFLIDEHHPNTDEYFSGESNDYSSDDGY
eukprot:TRINITY_DN31242_c0_g1_i1.p1 TRINITY_DN31242_c0_g1~~TRINITY_DN31242_c0_g1_i1.p1  ORF type:complete len:622 (-),score=97.61 TRINITY_DN31242_c0_g1_i1:128-1993(-)